MLVTQRSSTRAGRQSHLLGMMMLTVGVPTTAKRTKLRPADGPTSAIPGRFGAFQMALHARSPAA